MFSCHLFQRLASYVNMNLSKSHWPPHVIHTSLLLVPSRSSECPFCQQRLKVEYKKKITGLRESRGGEEEKRVDEVRGDSKRWGGAEQQLAGVRSHKGPSVHRVPSLQRHTHTHALHYFFLPPNSVPWQGQIFYFQSLFLSAESALVGCFQ